MLVDEKPEIKPIMKKKKISRNDALMDNSPEDMHIEDNFIGDIKPEKIEKKKKKSV